MLPFRNEKYITIKKFANELRREQIKVEPKGEQYNCTDVTHFSILTQNRLLQK